MAHVNTSVPPRRQPYWYHPRVVRLSVIGHSRWPPHGHGTLYHNTFGTRPLFPSSAENWRPLCSGRRSLMRSDNVLFARRSVLMCHHVLAVTNCLLLTLYGDLAKVVRWCHLNNIHFYHYYYYYLLLVLLLLLSGMKMRCHFSEQRWEWSDGCVILR